MTGGLLIHPDLFLSRFSFNFIRNSAFLGLPLKLSFAVYCSANVQQEAIGVPHPDPRTTSAYPSFERHRKPQRRASDGPRWCCGSPD